MGDTERVSAELPATIDEAEVTPTKLTSILQRASIENTIEDNGYIYVTDGVACPAYIAIDADRKFLCFYTHCVLKDEVAELSTEAVLASVNKLNQNHIVVQFHWDGVAVGGHYWMTYDGRLDTGHFIKMLIRFSSAFNSGLAKLLESLASNPPRTF